MGNVHIYIYICICIYIYMYNYIVHASCRHQFIFELGGTTEKVGIFVGPIVNRESYRDFNNKDMEHTMEIWNDTSLVEHHGNRDLNSGIESGFLGLEYYNILMNRD